MPCLIIETDELNKEPCTIVLGNEAIIGREKSNNIYIDDQRASRQHAKITKEPDGSYLLVDMGSRNGIIVNGEKVSRRNLIDKDRIVIGRTTLVYNSSAPSSLPGSESAPSSARPPAPAETMNLPERPLGQAGMTSDDKTITADPLGRPAVGGGQLASDTLKKAIQDVTSERPENNKPAASVKKPAPASTGDSKNAQASRTSASDEVINEEPTLGKRIIVFIAFLIFFVTILLFAREATKRLLFKAEKSHQAQNIPSSNQSK